MLLVFKKSKLKSPYFVVPEAQYGRFEKMSVGLSFVVLAVVYRPNEWTVFLFYFFIKYSREMSPMLRRTFTRTNEKFNVDKNTYIETSYQKDRDTCISCWECS